MSSGAQAQEFRTVAGGMKIKVLKTGSGEPVAFVIGTNKVMPAWNEGVIGMQVGGRRMLLIPPGMAYGNRSINDVIPANAALRMTLELVRLE